MNPAHNAEPSFAELLRLVDSRSSIWSDQLLKHGAILFRGFEVGTCDEFADLVAALSAREDLLDYRGGASPRTMIGGSRPVYNSTEYPPEMELSLHNELSYSDVYPAQIYFFCLTAPEEGGETTLGDSRRILAGLQPDVRRRFEDKGICYVRNLPSGRGTGYSWQDAFECDDPLEVERRCFAMGGEHEWLENDVLRIRQKRPAVAVHPVTGEEVWFNQADGFHPSALSPSAYAELLSLCGSEERFRLNVSYGDGEAISEEDLAAVRHVIRREAIPHVWRRGDVLMLDNLLTAHGRRPFRGQRRIAVAMS